MLKWKVLFVLKQSIKIPQLALNVLCSIGNDLEFMILLPPSPKCWTQFRDRGETQDPMHTRQALYNWGICPVQDLFFFFNIIQKCFLARYVLFYSLRVRLWSWHVPEAALRSLLFTGQGRQKERWHHSLRLFPPQPNCTRRSNMSACAGVTGMIAGR